MSRADAVDRLLRQLRVVTLALVGGIMAFAAVVTALHLAGREPVMALALPAKAGIALFGVVMLGAAQVVGASLSRTSPGAANDSTATKIRDGVLVSMGMRESVGLAGSVVGLLTGDLLLMSALVAASVATMLLGLPHRDEVENQLRRAGD